MRKAYIQPEAELLSLALLEDFLSASTEPSDDDLTVNGGTTGGSEGENGATDSLLGDNNGSVEDTTGGDNGYENAGSGSGKWN